MNHIAACDNDRILASALDQFFQALAVPAAPAASPPG
jgi:hypothetical protein